jgi:hypothetical protein
MALDVSKAGRPENSVTQINVMIAISTPAMAPSINRSVVS